MSDLILHANCIAFEGCGLLIVGKSGTGKSSLSLQMMAYGAQLVADDRTALSASQGALTAVAAPNIGGAIEARGLGILRAQAHPRATIHAVVDLNEVEIQRLPELRQTQILGVDLPLFFRVESPSFAAALLQYLRDGRQDTQ